MKRMIIAVFFLVLATTGFAQTTDSTIVVHLKGPAEFLVSDSLSRKTGFDPVLEKDYKDIPNSSYGTGGVGSEDPDFPAIEYSEFSLDYPRGRYTLEVIGVDGGRIELNGFLLQGKETGKEFSLIGVIGKGQRLSYEILYDIGPAGETPIRKHLTPSSFRQDLNNCFKLKLLGGKSLYGDLRHRAEQYEKWIRKRERKKARHELEKLEKKLDEVWKKSKKSPRDRNHFITEDAYLILKEDVTGLMGGATN